MKITRKRAGLAVAVVLIAFLAVDYLDEDLDPRITTYGTPRAPKVPDAENGYYALLALDGSDGADGMVYAQAWLAEARAAAREGRAANLPESKRAKRPDWCNPAKTSCLAVVRENGAEIAQQLAAFKEDLSRYETLISFRRFEEVLDFLSGRRPAFPDYASLAQVQLAYLLRVASAVEAGRIEEGVSALDRELAWQRLFLTESRLIRSKAMSAIGYWRDLMFIANLLETRTGELAPYVPRLRAMLEHIDAAVLDLPRTVETEDGHFVSELLKLGPQTNEESINWYINGGPLRYKPHATANRQYRYNSALANSVYAAPAHLVIREWEAFCIEWHENCKRNSVTSSPWWWRVYNPVGKSVTRVATPDWLTFPLFVHDVVALNRLIGLRVELLAAGVTSEQAPEAIARSDPRYHDPYTRKPMGWDAEGKRMYFEAKQFAKGRVFVAL